MVTSLLSTVFLLFMTHLHCIAINEKLFSLTHAILKHLREGHSFQNSGVFLIKSWFCSFLTESVQSPVTLNATVKQQAVSLLILSSSFLLSQNYFPALFLAFQWFLAQLFLCYPYLCHRKTEISTGDISVKLLFFNGFFWEVMWISFSFGASIAS